MLAESPEQRAAPGETSVELDLEQLEDVRGASVKENDAGMGPEAAATPVEPAASKMGTHQQNMWLLLLVFILFGGFAIAQMIFAIAGNSLSLIGDSSCMIVDAVTYGMNMVAERLKVRGVSERKRLQLELFIPLVSIAGLVATSIYIVIDAAATIQEGATGETDDTTMIIFSSINLGIDVVSMFFFVRARGLCGFRTVDSVSAEETGPAADNPKTGRSNMNMCSAYTHVTADSMRSTAVVVAAIVSIKGHDVDANLADAWAAIAVSIIIFLSLAPLIRGLVQKTFQLRKLSESERSSSS